MMMMLLLLLLLMADQTSGLQSWFIGYRRVYIDTRFWRNWWRMAIASMANGGTGIVVLQLLLLVEMLLLLLQQQQQQQQQHHQQQQQQQQLPFGDYDSVSDLSSFRFVFDGEEVDSTRRVLVDAHYEDAADDDDDVARPPVIEIEKRQPNTSTTKTEKSTVAIATATSSLGDASSPVLSLSSEISDESPAICCCCG